MPDIQPPVEPAPPGAGLGGADGPERRAFADPAPPRSAPHLPPGAAGHIAAAAEPLPAFDDPAFGRLFDRFGDAKVVLLGASAEGAAEFCRARAAVTRWLVEKRGFDIVALDADWADARLLDARVRGERRPPPGVAFADFPGWIWRNAEFDGFVRWLIGRNATRPQGARTAVHGLDRYGLAASMRAVADHLGRADPQAARTARERFGGLTLWATMDPGAPSGRYADSDGAVATLLADGLRRQLREMRGDGERLDAAQSARLAEDAEGYYRTLYYGGVEAWNRRSAHLFDTLRGLLAARNGAKAVVWAHNAHVGDARATGMGIGRGAVSLGQLCRETFGEDVRLIGLGAHGGAVLSAADWGAPAEAAPLAPAAPGDLEHAAHAASVARFLLDLRPTLNSRVRRALADPRPQRFVGPVRHPDDRADCRLPEQFDAWVWLDTVTPLTPLPADEATAWP